MNKQLPGSEQITPTWHPVLLWPFVVAIWNSLVRDNVLFFPLGQKPVQLDLSRRKSIQVDRSGCSELAAFSSAHCHRIKNITHTSSPSFTADIVPGDRHSRPRRNGFSVLPCGLSLRIEINIIALDYLEDRLI